MANRRQCTPEFKARAALELVSEAKSLGYPRSSDYQPRSAPADPTCRRAAPSLPTLRFGSPP